MKSETNRQENVLIGTSGWSYKEWEKIFYPDAKTPKLSYYSKVFRTAEIDSTFYAYPSKGLVFGWVKNTPESFEFSAKLPKLITHDKKLDLEKGVEIDLVKFLDLLAPLKDSGKLGPLLIQLPPSFDLGSLSKLKDFLAILPKDHRFAIEFRNTTWISSKAMQHLLEKYKIANTIVDEPLLPLDLRTTADFTFVRWHGHGKRVWYDYAYSKEELAPWVDRVKEISSKVKKVYGYFNNHFHGYAVQNSLELLESANLASDNQRSILKEIQNKRRESEYQKLL
ncbi:MAG: DUF72 domain-containing protein [Nitrososphaerota archaeon]|nr:DUF72 domain-containing protein [Nitrososphaerota archaeon]